MVYYIHRQVHHLQKQVNKTHLQNHKKVNENYWQKYIKMIYLYHNKGKQTQQTKGGNTMINIIYNNEIIDTTNDINEALYLKKEYELAFHTTGIKIEINL